MSDLQAIDIKSLPLRVRQLVKLIGVDATFRLLRVYGGRLTHIPATAYRNSRLDDIIGRENVMKLASSELAGRDIDLPAMDKLLTQLRNLEIKALKGQASKSEVSRRFGLTARMVQYIWNSDTDGRDIHTIDMFADSGPQ